MPNYEAYAALRNAKGLTDHQVARALRMSPSTFYEWKAGHYSPKLAKIMKIASFLGVKLEELLV